MKRIVLALAFVLMPLSAFAQITIPYTFEADTDILSSEVNANFSTLQESALKRDGSGTITGNVAVDADITIDGADISDFLSGTTLTSPGTTVFGGITYTWPGSQGANLYLKTDGSGGLSWASVSTTNTLLDGSSHTDTTSSSPTRGALVVGNSTPKWTALAVGSAGQYVRTDGTDTTFSYSPVSSQGSTFSASYGVDYYLVSGTTTVNLPSCDAGHVGKWVHVKDTGTGTVTLDGAGSEDIDGAGTYAMTIQYSSISLVCGSSGHWSIF